jgi:(2Fe-2S) ferredoxin
MAGTAPPARRWLLLEHPGPWPVDAVAGSGIQPDVLSAVQTAAARQQARILLVRRPGRQDPAAGRRWLLAGLDATTRSGPWGDDHDLLDAVDALERPSAPMASLEPPLILVCTHGVHDTCCAIRGRPVAAALAERWPDRVWECSHVGGDRFAPNVVLLPDGFYYGNLDPQSAVDVVTRHLAGTVASDSLRGMARFVPPVQAAAIAAYAELGPLGVGDVRVLSTRQVGPHDGHGSETFVDLEVTGHGRVAVSILSVRRKEEQLTCRAIRPTPATEYRIEGFQRLPAPPG